MKEGKHMYTIHDYHNEPLTKERIDYLFSKLNKELCKKYRKMPKDFKADLYVVGGACIVTQLRSRDSTTDIDAMWQTGDDMRECINKVGDSEGLGHTWCNCDFKRTKSYTSAIITNSTVYKTYSRLVVRMVKLDLLLAMKLVSFRSHKQTDREDCRNIIKVFRQNGINVNTEYIVNIVKKYYGSIDVISDSAKKFIGLR